MLLRFSKTMAWGLLFASTACWVGCAPAPAPAPSPSADLSEDDHEHGEEGHDHDDHGHDHEHGDHDHDHDHADHDHEHGDEDHADDKAEMKVSDDAKSEATEKPDTEKPAAEKPEAAKPAAEKPATEKPEAEKPAAANAAEKPEMKAPAAEEKPAEKPAEEKKADTAKPDDKAMAKADPKPEDAKPETKKPEAVVAGDWAMWGGDPTRNMVNKTTNISLEFEPALEAADGKQLKFTTRLGSQTYGNPVVAGGKVFVGTNNGGEYRPQHTGDKGCVLCFDAETGEFLWQLTRDKLPQGRVNDWPEQGICSTPCIEGDRMYVVTNRCEVMCVDVNGFYDDENNGPYTQETDTDKKDADIIWSLDMIDEYGVFPHNLATSSPVIWEDYLYVVTSNGVDEAHLEIPAPRSPSFMCLNKNTGEVVWDSNEPFDEILHGQWGSPAIGQVNGATQIYMPGGDGWLYAFEPKSGEILWKFDLNPKDSKWELGGRGTRNNIISTPVFIDNSVILAVGQDPEHGEGVGHIYRIDATKTGDVSPVKPDGSPNDNSAQIWHHGGVDEDGSLTGRKGELLFRRTISTVAVHDGLVYAPDLSGFMHCLDFETGERYWEYDAFAAIWGSPMVVDGKVFLGDEDGDLVILEAGKEENVVGEKLFDSSIYSTPTVANGKMYVSDRSRLYCFEITK